VFITGLVLAAGMSSRLGQPKQLLPFRDSTILDTTLSMARKCPFDQLLVALGGAAPEVRTRVDLSNAQVVENIHFTSGCSSSIVAALDVVDPGSDGIVLLLGDQPGVRPDDVRAMIDAAIESPLAVCVYSNGLGHPFWFRRSVFSDLRDLHGDKGVWRLLESGRHPVTEVAVEGPIPLDVDTWDEYEALLSQERSSR